MKLFIFFIVVFFSSSLSARVVEKVQAQVGEEMISLIDLKNFEKQIRENLSSFSSFLKPIFKKSKLLKDKKILMDFMVTRNMLFQIAQKEKLPSVSKKQIKKKVRQLKASSSHKAFSIKLKKVGLSLATLKKQILMGLKIDLLLSQFVASKIIVSEQDIESYHFNKYRRLLFSRFEYEFVSVQFTENKKPAFLKKTAEGTKGSDLIEIARMLGLEAKTLKLKGRDIQSKLKKELDQLSVSQISPVFVLGEKHYALQLQWKVPQISDSEQAKKQKIEAHLYQKKLNEEIKKWIEEKRDSFSIVQHSL